MKPILKNFSGSGVFSYQIRYEIKGCAVCLRMFIKTPFNENYEFLDNAVGLFDGEQENTKDGIRKALENAEKKWGLKLMEPKMEVA